ncbi:Wall-associated receptor kinase [Musa troglodytarum]|uniref:Wall-associated receptor kinase n=1 Tax=Musa troglodytarum TaxID=320322 RepID=A0A9E7FFS1_9LILI|nr:Wall-associated receptor kinase [Musa troglodytarum]
MVGKSSKKWNLAMHLISCSNQNQFHRVSEDDTMDERSSKPLTMLTELAKRCLKMTRDGRPTTKEVVMELEGLRRLEKHPWIKGNDEEEERLPRETASSDKFGAFSHNDSCAQAVFPVNVLR